MAKGWIQRKRGHLSAALNEVADGQDLDLPASASSAGSLRTAGY